MNRLARERIRARIRDVHAAVDVLEGAWSAGAPDHPYRTASGRGRMRACHLAELLDAFEFRAQMMERLNALFCQRSLAARYGVSKRCIEDYCRGMHLSRIND